MRIGPWAIALVVVALEGGWLALWPLSAALSQSPAFSTSLLDGAPAVAHLTEVARQPLALLLPELSEGPLSQAIPLGSDPYLGPAIGLTGLLVWLGLAYLAALWALDRGLGRRRGMAALVVAAALLFQATLLWQPGLFSQDVFSYVAYGRLAAVYELNPYIWPPGAIAKDPVVSWVADVWRDYAAPYGPVWMGVQWLLAHLSGARPVPEQVLFYRGLASGLLLANLGLLWAVLGRLGLAERGRRVTALAVLAWNPLVLFELAGNAHNDALMLTFSLLAIWLFARWRSGLAATASFTLGTLVKYLCGLGLAWVVVADVARASSLGRRGVVLAASAIVCASIVIVVAWPWLELPDSLEPILAETATVGYVNALPDNLALALAEPLQLGAAPDLVRAVERGLIVGGFLIYLGFEARRVWLAPTAVTVLRATTLSILLYLLLVSTSVQPWYFTLPVALAAGLGWRSSLARAAVGYSLLTAPALYLHYYLRTTTPWWVDLVYGLVPLLAACGPGLWARARTRLPAAAGTGLVDQGAGGRAVAGWVRLTEAPGGAPRTDRSSTVGRVPEPPGGSRHRGPS